MMPYACRKKFQSLELFTDAFSNDWIICTWHSAGRALAMRSTMVPGLMMGRAFFRMRKWWAVMTLPVMIIRAMNVHTDVTATGIGPWIYRIELE